MNEKDKENLLRIVDEIQTLYALKNYDGSKLLWALQHQLSQLVYFYRDIAMEMPSEDVYYKMRNYPNEHELVYVNLDRGFPKEMMDGHWCYVLKNFGYKLLVIPTTSIKKDSTYNEKFDYDIISKFSDKTVKSRLSISDMRCIDIQRIDKRKPKAKVLTERNEILEFVEDKVLK